MFWKLFPFIFLALGSLLGKPFALLFFGLEEGKNRKVPFYLSMLLSLAIFVWGLLVWIVFNSGDAFNSFASAIMAIGILISLPLIIFIICLLCRKSAKEKRAILLAQEEEEARRRKRDAEMIEEYERKKKEEVFNQEQEKEHAALLSKLREIPGAMNFCEAAEKMNSVAEICSSFKEIFGSFDSVYICEMISILEEANNIDRMYGNMKDKTCKLLNAFFRHDMRIFDVDRSGVSIVCPLCGKEQSSKVEVCFNCNALFRD